MPEKPPERAYEFNEDPLYRELQAADADVDRLMSQLDEMLNGASDRAEAEQRATRELVPSIEQARERAREALARWLVSIRRG